MIYYAVLKGIRIPDDKDNEKEKRTMRTLTEKECGNSQAHWALKPTNGDIAKVNEIVAKAVAECGLDCTFKVEVEDNDCSMLGYGCVKATISINNPRSAFRIHGGTLLKGLSEITARFYRKAAMLSYEEYRDKRQPEESRLFAELTTEAAKAAISSLPWDGEVFEFRGTTNGKARAYRHRHFYTYEHHSQFRYGGTGCHFQYSNTWDNLAKCFAEYVGLIAMDTGYAFRKDYGEGCDRKTA